MKTAVNYIENSLKLRKDGGDMYQFCIFLDDLQEIIDHAKEMEKQQIIDAYLQGDEDSHYLNNRDRMGEGYYNETFKSE